MSDENTYSLIAGRNETTAMPRLSTTRDVRISVRLTQEEAEILQTSAAAARMTQSEYVRLLIGSTQQGKTDLVRQLIHKHILADIANSQTKAIDLLYKMFALTKQGEAANFAAIEKAIDTLWAAKETVESLLVHIES